MELYYNGCCIYVTVTQIPPTPTTKIKEKKTSVDPASKTALDFFIVLERRKQSHSGINMTDMLEAFWRPKEKMPLSYIQIHSVFEMKLLHPITNLEFYKMYIFNDSGGLSSFF